MKKSIRTKYKISFSVETDTPIWREKVLDAVNAVIKSSIIGIEVVDDSNKMTPPVKSKIIDVEIV